MKIISNCPLCETHALHVIEGNNLTLEQCLWCGFASSDNFIGDKETNKEYKNLPDEMKQYAIENEDRIWIPGILTLPEGMIYPITNEDELKWAYATMVDILKEEQKNYPNPEGGFYTQKYDTDNQEIFDDFYNCINELNKKIEEKRSNLKTIKLPKLTKLDA